MIAGDDRRRSVLAASARSFPIDHRSGLRMNAAQGPAIPDDIEPVLVINGRWDFRNAAPQIPRNVRIGDVTFSSRANRREIGLYALEGHVPNPSALAKNGSCLIGSIASKSGLPKQHSPIIAPTKSALLIGGLLTIDISFTLRLIEVFANSPPISPSPE